jgi:hypothetical protein
MASTRYNVTPRIRTAQLTPVHAASQQIHRDRQHNPVMAPVLSWGIGDSRTRDSTSIAAQEGEDDD